MEEGFLIKSIDLKFSLLVENVERVGHFVTLSEKFRLFFEILLNFDGAGCLLTLISGSSLLIF